MATFVLVHGVHPRRRLQPSAFQGIAQRLRQDPSWTVIALPCGHDVMVDMPRELANALMAAA